MLVPLSRVIEPFFKCILSIPVETIQSLEPNAKVSEDNLTIARERVTNSKDDIIQWLDSLNI